MTPSRAPSSGRHSKGTAVEDGSLTILIAPAMSKATGKSMKITSDSVMAKSCIIVECGTSTGSEETSVPEGSMT